MRNPSIPVLCAASLAAAGVPPVAGVQNHWVGNTGGNSFSHIQNFIEEMVVKPDGSVLTQSFWDEAQRPASKYKDGAWIGYNWETDSTNPHPSRRAIRQGVTWEIRNFYGRAFLGKMYPPPVGDSAPFVVSTRGDTIRSVEDPTAVAFDLAGRLLVADNGPDQNIKIFDVSVPGRPRRVATFGDSLGVFGGPVRGRTGARRFWGPRGVGVDSLGRLFVGCTGMPMQVGGGTDIRCFSGLTDSDTLVWQVQCEAFVNTVDADPDSGGTSLQKNSTRFHMDWSQPPGRSWSFAAVTTDPFRYPDDPRLCHSLESNWFRRIGGRRFQFQDDMYASYMVMNRYEDGSEIGIPTLFLPVWNSYRDSGAGVWAIDRRPIWGAAGSGDKRRWIWRDDNADGQVQSTEFHTWEMDFPYTYGVDVDDSGDIWWGGKPYMVQFPTGGLDANGIPRYPVDRIKLWSVPFAGRDENNGYVMFCRYLKGQDAMIVATGVHERLLASIYRYDHWSTRAIPFPGFGKGSAADTLSHTWKITVPYKFPADWSTSGIGSSMDTCLFPNNLAADSDYVYVGYVDKGPHSWRNGEVDLYDVRTGAPVGWVAPGPETNFMSGWFDLWHAVNAYTRPNGEKLLMVEEDFAGKVNVYRWCPKEACPEGKRIVAPATPLPVVRRTGRKLSVTALAGQEWGLAVWGLDGATLVRTTGFGPAELDLPGTHRVVYAGIRSGGNWTGSALLGP